ncbi:MAG: hypothetical protein WBC44_01105 [Planctomycetaceae bacterium]
MKIAILIAVALYIPLVMATTAGAMIYSIRHRAVRPQGVREVAVILVLLTLLTSAFPVLILFWLFRL